MLLVASSLSAKSLFDGLYKGICEPRAQHSYDISTKTKSHLKVPQTFSQPMKTQMSGH